MKYDFNGNPLWVKLLSHSDVIVSMVRGSDGIYLAGAYCPTTIGEIY